MRLKELKEKYKGYDVVLFGRPLSQPTIPFTFLPRDRKTDDLEVVDYRVIDKEFTQYGVRFRDLKPIKPKVYKGRIDVYVK